MRLSDLTEHGTLVAERRAADSEYAAESDRLAAAAQLSAIIVDYRARHGLSQSELGRQLGWKQPQVARLENGEHLPNLASLRTLAQHKIVSVVVDGSGINMRRPTPRKRPVGRKKATGDMQLRNVATKTASAGKTAGKSAGRSAASRKAVATKTAHRKSKAAKATSRAR